MKRVLPVLALWASACTGSPPPATTSTSPDAGPAATASSSIASSSAASLVSSSAESASRAGSSQGAEPDAGPSDAGIPGDSGPADAGGGADAGKATDCASEFGSALTNAFGRVDGTVVAVVQPQDTQCPLPNNDHLVLQVRMGGAVYRMVVNLQSSFGDPNVRFAELQAPLPAPAFADGWHTGISLDYVNTLMVHMAAFTPYPLAGLSQRVTDRITVGAPVSVYATSSGGTRANSAHLVHRNNGGGRDGAIVLDPTGPNPTWLLFAFANQTF